MALSRRSTTIAVFRGVLGPRYGQEARFARLAGRSVSWVKKVSAGGEPLTGDVALQLERATGIAAAWLLNGDPTVQPVGASGKAYDLAAFERHRAAPEAPEPAGSALTGQYRFISGIAASAARKGRESLFQYRLSQFLEECREEFGFVEDARPERVAPVAPRDAERKEKSAAKIPEPETETPELEVHLL